MIFFDMKKSCNNYVIYLGKKNCYFIISNINFFYAFSMIIMITNLAARKEKKALKLRIQNRRKLVISEIIKKTKLQDLMRNKCMDFGNKL